MNTYTKPIAGMCPGSLTASIAKIAETQRAQNISEEKAFISPRPRRLRGLCVSVTVARLIPLLLSALILALPVHANVVTIGDARFPVSLQAGDGRVLELKGAGLARYAMFIRVYGAGFYAPEGLPAAEVLEQDEPKRLEIEYFVDIAASDLALAADTILEKQLSPEQFAALEPRIRQLHNAYEKVSSGDRYVFEYIPGQGTRLSLNGSPRVTVEGRDFARAYFGIWLGEQPLSPGLRDALLGMKR